MKKAWVISVLALGAFCGHASPSASLSSVPSSIAIIPAAFAQAQPVEVTRFGTRFGTRFEGSDDHFIHSLGSPRMPSSIRPERRSALSKIRMSIQSADLEETLPRFAPGAGPNRVAKADRDQGGTAVGRVFISQHGLTVNLF